MSDKIDLPQTDRDSQARARRERGARFGLLWMFAAAVLMAAVTFLLLPHGMQGLGPDPSAEEMLRALLPSLLAAGLIAGGGIVLGAISMARAARAAREDLRKTANVLQGTVAGLDPQRLPPPPGSQRSKKQSVLIWAFVIAGLLAIAAIPLTRGLLERLFPAAEDWLGLAVPVALFAVTFSVIARVAARRAPEDTSGSMARDILRSLGGMVPILILFGVALWAIPASVEWLISNLGNPVVASVLLLGGGLVVLAILPMGVMWVPILWIFIPLRRADYEGALRRVRRMRRTNPKSAMALFMEGTVLDYAGRYSEAEDLLRESLIQGQAQVPAESQAVALENQGFVYLKQGRYGEAQRAFEGSIEIRPEGSGPYSGLAEVYLRQGIEPQRALDLTEKALQRKGASFLIRTVVDNYRWAEIWGNKAWALALLGDHAGAQRALDQAYRHAPRRFKAEMAMLYYRAAQVTRLKGDTARAIGLLRAASQIDPAGGAGRLAAQALREGV